MHAHIISNLLTVGAGCAIALAGFAALRQEFTDSGPRCPVAGCDLANGHLGRHG